MGRYSFGCIILTPNGETIKESGNGDNPASLAIRNVAGEMLGAMFVVKWGIKNGYRAINICYDYTGIEMWAIGAWKAKNQLTQKYAEFMKECKKDIQISFTKIAAHTGNKYNEEADRLAKSALTEGKGIPKIKRGDFWFTVPGIEYNDLCAVISIIKEELESDSAKVSQLEKDIAYGKSIVLKLEEKDKITINYYQTGDKVVIQGKPQKLFSMLMSYLTELVDIEEIPKIYNDTYKLSIDKDEVQSEFNFYLPNAYNRLPQKMERTLHQAVYNLKIEGDMFDGTFLAQPVIRVIDAHLKLVLLNYGIIPNANYVKGKDGYDMFDKVGAKYKLKPDRLGKTNEEEARYIGNCYTFFSSNRNVLSHWDDPTTSLDTTKLLNVAQAHDLIKRTLALIDEYYELV